ncbi:MULTISPECIES: polysaccharide deacetylase family protein [unclassified Undibacterium]|uniref:polysaccharide deacetylase family protein n=1 Tax=unclassified Undibacterium TaxID=2630295 RepID=UPI002AC9919B|nr:MULTISPECIES: polysaccharide deacetylase family protein [unclassified Undibacterium]MEB0139670.1 polysaccharide deacetylase family protein [Undibacterium sp. CCC2.1]MEB0172551.1 polysaccharide deacetylase family protein [Undibacterium sp. CCC1.1]MEB0176353.1 polysaccharide deacetylase family protein [Undibacterium sp. CCC3.4]MEB0215687.1 polysaccharide deacetylase family protein [Undibacterium sp. 5I2]WPX42965.1 polysaccharide deacetylase family protein [Undibacterium sp. CCC3.4]
MPVLVLKIDVDTWRGTREGVPNLVRILQQHQAGATFLFSLGKDHTGWALRRAFRPGFFQKVSRTSVLEHYGVKTLMYGVFLPAPDIGACTVPMRAVQAAGFECGIHTWDHVVWQDNVRTRDAAWTRGQMQQAHAKFSSIFGQPPATHGAAGWQMNATAFAELDRCGMAYASDGRAMLNEDGSLQDPAAGPYRLQVGAQVHSCVQMPTTLPTLDELLGRSIDGVEITLANIAAHILKLTAEGRDHVFTLHAELEGQKLAPILEQLLTGWHEQGYRCASMADYYATISPAELPIRPLTWASLPGRSGDLVAVL